MKNTNYFLLASLLLILGSCKKGDPGNTGETGPAGVAGAAGNTGAAGPAGTANVIYSDWITAKNFRDTTADNSKLRIADLAAPKLTDALLANGVMMVYMNFGAGVYTLPYASFAGGKLNTINFLPRAGKFIITRFTADNSGTIPLSVSLQYRYVIIPGGISATAVANKVNLNNYESVRKFYKLTN